MESLEFQRLKKLEKDILDAIDKTESELHKEVAYGGGAESEILHESNGYILIRRIMGMD